MLDKNIIVSLIKNKEENDICDFKLEWPKKLGGIIKDIICFSNRLENNDAYIILGVNDENKSIVGIENTQNRSNQANLTDCLKKYPFAEQRPQFTVNTIKLQGHEIDVITIKSCKNSPIYLTRDFDKLRSGFIYTRVNDCNGSTEESIDPKLVENLWKKRFNLLDSDAPNNKIWDLLKDKENWVKEKQNKTEISNVYYYKFNPKYKCLIRDDDNDKRRQEIQTFSIKQCDPSIGYSIFECYFETTCIFTCLIIWLDGYRFIDLYPQQQVIGDKKDIIVNYFIKNSPEWVVRSFLIYHFDKETAVSPNDRKMFEEDIIFYENEEEKSDFLCYLTTSIELSEHLHVVKEGTTNCNNNLSYYEEKLRYIQDIVKLFKEWKSKKIKYREKRNSNML